MIGFDFEMKFQGFQNKFLNHQMIYSIKNFHKKFIDSTKVPTSK
jgi:hypothetical protein